MSEKDEPLEVGTGDLGDNDLDDAPQTWFHDDKETVAKADAWIACGHPQECGNRLRLLLGQRLGRYDTVKYCLVAHSILEHEAGIEILIQMYAGSFPLNEEKVGLSYSIKTKQSLLTDEVLSRWETLNDGRAGASAISLIARHIDDDHFISLWESVWNKGFAQKAPYLAGAIFLSSAFSKPRSSYSIKLTKEEDTIFEVIPNDLVRSLVWSEELRSIRDEVLDRLLSRYQHKAARVIINASNAAQEIPQCIGTATRILMEALPDDPSLPIGVGLCLQVEPAFAIETIVRWVNEGKSLLHYDQFLRWKIESADQKKLFGALASDAVARNPVWHNILAKIHHDLTTNVDPVIEWLDKTLNDKQAARYNGSLLVSYLSEPHTPDLDKTKRLIQFAHALHDKFGSREEKVICQESNLTYTSLKDYETLVAIAIAKDIIFPTKSVDIQYALKILKTYPFTYKALGAEQLDADMERGLLPPFIHYYTVNLESEIAELKEKRDQTKIEPLDFELFKSRLLGINQFRKNWEQRFEKIIKSGTTIPAQRLREDPNIWTEARILAPLVDCFHVKYEPEGVAGMGTNRPDFLLSSSDGQLVFEIARVGAKPEDVREDARFSKGGILKKTLQNKLHDKFNDCKCKLPLPAVIAVEMSFGHDDEFDVLNSLYGPLQFILTIEQKSKSTVAEGTKREVEKAFFSPETACISAVAAIAPDRDDALLLDGKLYRPIDPPQNPIRPELWLRLRRALFGPTPKNLLAEIGSIPGILREEAKMLVEYGVDDLSFFASGRISLPDGIKMESRRFEELRNQAERLMLLYRTGQIAYLPSAQELDLSAFWRHGVFTMNQLLQIRQRPIDVDEKVWNTLRREAAAVLQQSDSL
ncbi:MAG: hypothetical protein ABSA92_14995 [Candidatus Bathyarchaeia archaeon]|jgi:hypothetical protein